MTFSGCNLLTTALRSLSHVTSQRFYSTNLKALLLREDYSESDVLEEAEGRKATWDKLWAYVYKVTGKSPWRKNITGYLL